MPAKHYSSIFREINSCKFLKIQSKKLESGHQKESSKDLGVDIYIMPSTSGVNTRFTTKDLAKLLKSYINNKIYA